jgi:FkbM family methyltransferase
VRREASAPDHAKRKTRNEERETKYCSLCGPGRFWVERSVAKQIFSIIAPKSVTMKPYHLELSSKTRLLNIFRKVFTKSRLLENILVYWTVKKNNAFAKKFVPPDYLYKKGSKRSVTRDGIKYNLDISNVVDHYLYYGNKDADYTAVLDDIKKAKVILDIGTNIGVTNLFFTSQNPNVKVYGFEPHPQTFKRALDNFEANHTGRNFVYNIGLGDRKGVMKLYEVNEHNPGMNRLFADEKEEYPYKEVQIETLDSFMKSKGIAAPEFIKIDVEGFEYQVLQGGLETLKAKPVLFIELDDSNLRENNSSASQLVDLLFRIGYSKIFRADNLKAVSVNDDFTNCHYDIVVK